MNSLEEKIYNCAIKILPKAYDKVKKTQTECKYIEIPFKCDGCFDKLIYDREQEKFTKIVYFKGKGVETNIDGVGEFSAFFDEVERVEMDISDLQ